MYSKLKSYLLPHYTTILSDSLNQSNNKLFSGKNNNNSKIRNDKELLFQNALQELQLR